MERLAELAVAHVVRSSGTGDGDDRIALVRCSTGLAVVVADGAGGTGNGALAAERLVAFLREALLSDDAINLVEVMERADRELVNSAQGGQSTGVVVMICGATISGASVGDSEAWLVGAGVQVLTADQHRKPLLGTGEAAVVPFVAPFLGTLIVGTDGLFKYANRKRLVETVHGNDLLGLPGRLVELVRLRGGVLQDDVAVVAIRAGGP